MTKSKRERIFSMIAAICYTVYASYYFINNIINAIIYDEAITLLRIFFWIATFGMAVTLFMKNQKAVAVAGGVNVLLDCFYIISYFNLCDFCNLIAYAGIVALIFLSIKGKSAVKKIWFVPAGVMSLGYITNWISGNAFIFFPIWWQYILIEVVEIVAMLFVGLWLKETITPVDSAPVNEYLKVTTQTMYSASNSSPVIGGADKLKMYKELLDSGIITQDEFDAKKKEILGQ